MHNKASQPELPLPKPAAPARFRVPEVHIPVVRVPNPDGSVTFRPGKPEALPDEVDVPEAARILGLSDRSVQRLCDEGDFKTANQPGGPGGKWFISRAEVLERKQPPKD